MGQPGACRVHPVSGPSSSRQCKRTHSLRPSSPRQPSRRPSPRKAAHWAGGEGTTRKESGERGSPISSTGTATVPPFCHGAGPAVSTKTAGERRECPGPGTGASLALCAGMGKAHRLPRDRAAEHRAGPAVPGPDTLSAGSRPAPGPVPPTPLPPPAIPDAAARVGGAVGAAEEALPVQPAHRRRPR